MILQLSPTVNGSLTVLARLIGLAVFAGFVSTLVALLYRWYVRERVPSGLALLVALAGVAVVLNTTPLLAAEIAADDETLEIVDALFNVVAFAGSAGAAFAGVRFGDHLGTDLGATGGTGDVDADASEIVQTVGRVTSIQLPEEIADVVGYDPVPEETKETLAGRRFLFPRRLTETELRDRLVSRLKTDYGVGHVDVEFGADGAVEFLAVGSRAAGIGPTLPPATNAVAIRADPAHAASAGDLVQVWETGPMQRVLTGELRGVAGDVVTVAIDAADTPKLDPTERYKLVTLPVQDRPDREFASLLRAAAETLATVTVEAGSALDGVALDSLDVTIAAITREDERPEPLPTRSRSLQAGDVVYVIATPEILRKVDSAASGPTGAARSVDSAPEPPDPGPEPVEAEPEPADPDDESGGADGAVSDQPSPAESDGDDDAADVDPLAGDAFVDTDDAHPDDHDEESGDVDATEANAEPDEPGAIDDALDSMGGTLDSEESSEADPGSGNFVDDALTGDTGDETLIDESIDESLLDGSSGETANDEAVDETANDEPVDGAVDDEPAEEAENDESAEEAADDDSVPFTPLDVGDDDPLSDPLTEGNEDEGDGFGASGREEED